MPGRPKLVGPLRTGIQSGLVSKRITDIDFTVDLQALALQASYEEDEAIPDEIPRAGSPVAVVTPPGVSTFTMFLERPRQGSEVTIKPLNERPKLRRKAYTAPSGTLQVHRETKSPFVPHPPRRAVSSTTAEAFSRSGSRDRRRPSKDNTFTPSELSKLRIAPSRSLISKKRSKRNSGGRMGLKSKPLVWRMSSPPKTYELPPELKQSFSEKARVKKTLNSKKVDTLQVDIPKPQQSGLPSTSAVSIVPTPSIFYKRPASIRAKTPPSPARSATSFRGIGPVGNSTLLGGGAPPRSSTPLRLITSPRSTSLPKTPPRSTPSSAGPTRIGTPARLTKHFSSPLSPVAQQRVPWRRSIGVDQPSRHATPVPSERNPVYIPGPIQLEEKITATPRRGSIANLERFDDGSVPRAKRFSDLVALDSIVMYFQALGVAEEASDACLDRFWTQSRKSNHASPGKASRKTMPPVPGAPPPPPRPVPSPPSSGVIATTFEGIFRTQKTLREDADQTMPPSPGTAGRRKPLLRQLLKASRKSS